MNKLNFLEIPPAGTDRPINIHPLYVFPNKKVTNPSGEETFNPSTDFDLNLFLEQKMISVKDLILYLVREIERNGPMAREARLVVSEVTNRY